LILQELTNLTIKGLGKHQIFNILRKFVIGDVELEHYKNFQVDVLHPQVDELTLV